MIIVQTFHMLYIIFVLILSCNGQSFHSSYSSKVPLNYNFPSTQQLQQLQSPQSIQFNPLLSSQNVNIAASISSTSFDPIASDKVSRNILQLGQEILTKLDSHVRSKAQVFSPVCIVSALALILLGSNGQTYHELKNIFDLSRDNLFSTQPFKFHEEFAYLIEDLINDIPIGGINRKRTQPPWKFTYQPELRFGPGEEQNFSSPHDYHHVEVANGIFIQSGFSLRRDYENVVKGIYKSEITSLEFTRDPTTAKNYINDWVNRKTHGKIKTIISDEIAPDTNVIIASALYFKALWEKTFLGSATQLSDFYPNGFDAPPVKVHMMANGGVFPYYDAKEYGCQILGLPYVGDISTMYIIQPYDSNAQKLHQFQATLTADKIEDMISKMSRKTALIAFPKLHVTNTINMKQIFSELGVNTLFNQDKCDLSLMADGITPSSVQQNVSNPISNLIRVPIHPIKTQHNDAPLIFTRLGNEYQSNRTQNLSRSKRSVTYKVESSFKRQMDPLRLKDFVLNKRITKHNPGKKLLRSRREVDSSFLNSIKNLELLRNNYGLHNPKLFVEDIVHKVDLIVNERGTEGGAATVAYIRRSGTDIVFRVDTPFIILVRHDPTKLPLFYGTIYEPTDF